MWAVSHFSLTKTISENSPVTFIIQCVCAGLDHVRYEYIRGCKRTTRPRRPSPCECIETDAEDIECECHEDLCNGAHGFFTDECSEPGAAHLKKGEEEEDSSVGAVMIVDVVVLITGVVASQLLI